MIAKLTISEDPQVVVPHVNINNFWVGWMNIGEWIEAWLWEAVHFYWSLQFVWSIIEIQPDYPASPRPSYSCLVRRTEAFKDHRILLSNNLSSWLSEFILVWLECSIPKQYN